MAPNTSADSLQPQTPEGSPAPLPLQGNWWEASTALGQSLGSIFDRAGIGAWEVDFDSRTARRSPTHAVIFGDPPEQVDRWSFETFRDRVHPDDVRDVDDHIAGAMRAGRAWDFECRIVRPDRSTRWVAIRGAPVARDGNRSQYARGIVLDVTEQRTADLAHQENTRHFALLANSAPVLIWTSGPDKLCDFFNLPWLQFTGRSMEQELGNGWTERVHPEDLDRCMETYVSHFDRRIPFQMEYRLRRHDNTYRWLLDHGVPRHHADGTFAGYVGACIDVTEQKAAQESRHLAEEQVRLQSEMLAHMVEGVVLVAAETGIIVSTNPKMDRMLGYAGGELRGRHVSTINAPGDLTPEERARGIMEHLRKCGSWEGEIENLRKDHSVITCRATVTRFVHSQFGEVWLSVLKDVTHSKRMERALRESKERYDTIVANISTGVQLVRLHPDGTYTFDFVSPRTAELLGLELEALSRDATLWTQNAWPEDAALAAEATRQSFAAKSPYHWEGRFEVAGATRWLRFDGLPVPQPNGDVLYHAVVNDISEQKELEATRREALKSKAIGQLAGGLAHEFNNILAAMLMGIQLARDDAVPPEVSATLDDLENGCVRAGRLIKQLLALSQRSILKAIPIDLGELVDRVTVSLKQSMGSGLTIRRDGDAGPMPVHADATLLELALRCLCENASEAMDGQGTLVIGLYRQEISEVRSPGRGDARAGSYACLTVTDHGRGMTPGTLERLFEPFFTTKEVGRGPGLGLASVRGIALQHRGWVEVESQVGQGSSVRLFLPLTAEVNAQRGSPYLSGATEKASPIILLAEDDVGLRKVVSQVLQRAGYRVLVASDAAAARAEWRTHASEIDLLLTDVEMPGGESGVDLAQALLLERPDLRVILTSGYSAAMVSRLATLPGHVRFLPKPAPSGVLLDALRQALAAGN